MTETVGPLRHNLNIYRGDTFSQPFAFLEDEDDARIVEDLALTSGSTSATSATAAFTTGDNDKKLVAIEGLGIDDGTTMTYVSATEVTLSAPATATLTDVLAAVRGLNCSAFTCVAEYRTHANSATAAATFTVDDSRSAVGVFDVTLSETLTADLPRSGVWDLQATGPDGVSTWVAGKVTVTKDATHD